MKHVEHKRIDRTDLLPVILVYSCRTTALDAIGSVSEKWLRVSVFCVKGFACGRERFSTVAAWQHGAAGSRVLKT